MLMHAGMLILPVLTLPTATGTCDVGAYNGWAEQVIYTSGSSDTPKGVMLGDYQSAVALAGHIRPVGTPNRTVTGALAKAGRTAWRRLAPAQLETSQ